MPKGTSGAGTRTSAFGLYNRPIGCLRNSVRDLLAEVRHRKCQAEQSATRVFPVKRLRNGLIKAMSIDAAMLPATVDLTVKSKKKTAKKPEKTIKVTNPMWVLAPKGAFYKSKRICSLVTDIVMFGGNSNLAHDIERMAINIWHMSKRHFDGLCRRIRAKIAQSVESDKIRKSPETVKRFEALITNPCRKLQVVKWFARNRTCPHKKGYAAARLSTKVELVTWSHKCKRCTIGLVP